MVVYIVTSSNYDEHFNVGVYLSEEKAIKAAKRFNKRTLPMRNFYDVEAMEVKE